MEIREFETSLTLEYRADKTPIIKGLASPVYDGTPLTQCRLDDHVFERFLPGAFDAHLATSPEIFAYAEHNENKLLGITPDTLSLRCDAKGLHYEIVGDETTEFRDAMLKVQNKKYRGSSICFEAKKVEWIKEGGNDIRVIKQAKLVHVSPVKSPAYKATETTVAMRELQLNHDKELHELREKRLQVIIDTFDAKTSR